MRRLFAVVLSALLIIGFAPVAKADIAGLTPCAENARFQQRASTADTPQAIARFDRYSKSLCGDDGLPHALIPAPTEPFAMSFIRGHEGEIMIPGVIHLYILGIIGWAGRSYLHAIKAKGHKQALHDEIHIDTVLAFNCMLRATAWPWLAHAEGQNGSLRQSDNNITVSPR
ncbi:MAG: Photosystem I reaction center subunit III [Prochlorococcaceae cyanobacterium ETNP7_MAG_30]|jgi:photosystem I subunit 3|nr:Photosystem I reaction center subunit III [Prochlorococcaceae cyanobacterium ETNP2_MAG_10]MDP6196692.1 Photosystem I reaction center subunit III [Prochlorococcaceae cyanobacterium ETNP18_MAG_17]MDP6321494.1 Photosystem I reaction center subunit III [Prochlorococcaceae cyanobacterium ETNP14_MAG_5]MDP7327719.1 Photosystem I reaction center subunit III [Prochlorococcaceae cyanobacterium ETNP7_MAG_30]HJO78309.1 Photosystem I reaction center subunit III [Prochlorococcaceae cyanobacterium Fu_MAG_1